jgi:hypothetical protein
MLMLILSLGLQCAAFVWSLLLLRRYEDRRLAVVPLVIAVLALEPLLGLFGADRAGRAGSEAGSVDRLVCSLSRYAGYLAVWRGISPGATELLRSGDSVPGRTGRKPLTALRDPGGYPSFRSGFAPRLIRASLGTRSPDALGEAVHPNEQATPTKV